MGVGVLGSHLRWFFAKRITFTEWNDAINGPLAIDIHPLGDGWILDDIYFEQSEDFDDSNGTEIDEVGWLLDPMNPGGNTRIFRGLAAGNSMFLLSDDWPLVISGRNGGQQARGSTGQYQSFAEDDSYGSPALIRDAATAGPLQILVVGNGDATEGYIDVWLLAQRVGGS